MTYSPIEIAEFTLLGLGMVLWLVALARGRALEWFGGHTELAPWHIVPTEFLAFVAASLVSMVGAPALAIAVFSIDADRTPMAAQSALILGYALQLGWLGVCAVFCLPRHLRPPGGTMRWPLAAVAGGAGILLYFPAGEAAGRISQFLLSYLHIPETLQDSVNYLKNVGSVGEFLWWTGLVVFLAPVVEEWMFRRLLYRFLTAYAPEWVAVGFSAVCFAAMHSSVTTFLPLTVLGIALALAYRYTGRMITPIVMHAAFNLNTLVYVVLSRGT